MSKKIYLKKYLGSNKEKTLVEAYLSNKTIKFNGDAPTIAMLEAGIENPNNKIKLVYPRDGELFLQAMLNIFDSPYLFASNN